ncbi:hypothetical protein [Legionella tunisiensis]|uniref:hypothetical protein n=1 Tax=Legionella tunisiensis TaxID=1034944 RepID=UPI00031E0AD9|nr:hypothetical protein [Legionella tunisiensis]
MICKIEFISVTSAQELRSEIRTDLVKQSGIVELNKLVAEGAHPQVNLAARVSEKQVGLLSLVFLIQRMLISAG